MQALPKAAPVATTSSTIVILKPSSAGHAALMAGLGFRMVSRGFRKMVSSRGPQAIGAWGSSPEKIRRRARYEQLLQGLKIDEEEEMHLARECKHQDISTICQRRFYTTCVGISQWTQTLLLG
jgi:hypothetical protein